MPGAAGATAAGRAGPSPEATPALPPASGGSPRHRGLRRGPSRGRRGCGTALRTRSPVSAPSPSRTPSRHGGSRVPSPLPAPRRGRRLVTHSLRLNVDLPKRALGTSAPSSACRSSPSRQAPRSGPGRASPQLPRSRRCPGAGERHAVALAQSHCRGGTRLLPSICEPGWVPCFDKHCFRSF